MARIQYSGLVDNIRGSIGGTTFQSNKHGYTIKRKPNMVHPNSPLQNSRKSTFALAVRAWQQLTTAQRADWNAWASTYPQYAKFNPSSQLTGYEVFVRQHAYLFMCGRPVITNPSYTVLAQDTISISVYIDTGVLWLSEDSAINTGVWWVVNFISRPFSPSSNFIGTKTRFINFFINDDDASNITSDYVSLFGSIPSVGDRIAVDNVQVSASNGQFVSRVQAIITVDSA